MESALPRLCSPAKCCGSGSCTGARRPAPTHVKNSYASETPVTDGERVYAYFGNVGVFCFDFEGRPVWSKPLEPHAMRDGWGTAASPVLHGDRLYLVNDNEEQSYLLALDKRTGKEVWRVDRDEKSNWSTPYVWENDQRTEIVTPGSGKVRAYDLDGKLLWWFKGMSGITIATPYADQGLAVRQFRFCRRQAAAPLRHSTRRGRRHLAPARPDEQRGHRVVQPDRRALQPDDAGLRRAALCPLRPRAAERLQLADGQAAVRAAAAAGRHALHGLAVGLQRSRVLPERRRRDVRRAAGDKFELLHTNKLADDDMCMATPAMVGDRLLIRTSARIYCIRNQELGIRD